MAKQVTIGSCTFCYPEQGTKSGWGECATDAFVTLVDRVNTLSGPNDINLTTVCLSNAISCATNVGTGACTLSFSVASVRSFETTYAVIRTDCCCVITSETGIMTGIYNGSSWQFAVEQVGCAGICFQITCAGQVQYYTDPDKGAGSIKFKASTIAQ